MKYRIRIWSGDKTIYPIIDHRTDSLSEAKHSFYHWIEDYYRSDMDRERYIMATDVDGNDLARCIIHPGGHIEWRWEKWGD